VYKRQILLIDEVLAVGDVDFQRRCIKKMKEVIERGRTVIIVSHSLSAVEQLCERVILINRGQVEMIGPTEEVLAKYLLRKSPSRGHYINTEAPDISETNVFIREVRVRNKNGEVSDTVDAQHPFSVEIDYEILQPISFGWLGFVLSTVTGVDVLAAADGDADAYVATSRQPGKYTSVCQIPANLFNAGSYFLAAYAAKTAAQKTMAGKTAEIFVFLERILIFDIENPAGRGSHMPNDRVGVISPKLNWEVRPLSQASSLQLSF
jgi:lipopolysaccharide transport system ATP-binding protein